MKDLKRDKHIPVLLGAFALMTSASVITPLAHANVGAWFHTKSHTVNEEVSAPGIAGKTIVIDPGHGGRDSGARGVGGVQEKDITLAVARRLTAYLHEAGAVVVTTRGADVDLSTDEDRAQRRRHMGDLQGRLQVVRKQHIDAFVSIHCNAAPSPNWHGAQVLYFRDNEQGKTLATIMQHTYGQELLSTHRDIQSNRTLYLLKRIQGPTVLSEIGFITNPSEARALQSPRYQDQVAFATYESLVRYFSDPTVQIPTDEAQEDD